MIDPEQPLPNSKKHYWGYFPVLVILGLAVYILLPQIANLQNSWAVVKSMTWWAVGLAACAETISWLGNGIVIWAILDNRNHKLSIGKGSLIALGTLSISLVAGGGVGLAVMIGWIRHETHDGHIAFLAGTLPPFLNNGVLLAVSLFGTAYLLFVRVLSRLQLIEFSLVLFLLGLLTTVVLLALRSKKTATNICLWLNSLWNRIRHKSYTDEKVIEMVDQFFYTLSSLQNGKWRKPLLGAVINVGFDMTAMFFLFIAAGYRISLGDLLAGYGFPLALGKLAFILPGGIGVVETSMVAVFSRLHVPSTVSVVVTMGYRLFSFWLPTVIGFIAAAYLSGKLFSKEKK
jgi:glycosyltransferase 2 family protein